MINIDKSIPFTSMILLYQKYIIIQAKDKIKSNYYYSMSCKEMLFVHQYGGIVLLNL